MNCPAVGWSILSSALFLAACAARETMTVESAETRSEAPQSLEFVDGEARAAKLDASSIPLQFVGRFESHGTDSGDVVELSVDGRYSWEYRYRTKRYEKGTVRVSDDWLVFDVETRDEYMPPRRTMHEERACVLVWRDHRFLVRESDMAAFCNMLNSRSTVLALSFLMERTKNGWSSDYTAPQLPSPYDRYLFTEPLISTLLSTGGLIPDGTTSNRELEFDVGAADGAWTGMHLFLLDVAEEYPTVPRAWLTEIGEHTSKGRMRWWEKNLDAMPSVGRKFSTRDPRATAP